VATNNRGTRGGNRRRAGRDSNPKGRNQNSGIIGTTRENPLATAAAIGGAVAAGLFLWSRRNQISDQIGNLADQIGEWREGIASDDGFTGEDLGSDERASRRPRRTQAEIAEEALTLKETGRAS
jgi:hypothetical protein